MADPIASVKTLLTSNWNKTLLTSNPPNTDSITPIIDAIYNYKRLDGNRNQSAIWIYSPSAQSSEFPGLGKTTEGTVDSISIDIRTFLSREHLVNLLDEVKRIMDGNIISPDSDYHTWVRKGVTDLTDKNYGLFRYVVECELEVLLKTRAT